MKPQTLLIGILSALWILGGAWFLTSTFCPATNSTAAATTTLNINDGSFNASSTGSFNFGMSSAALNTSTDVQNNVFAKVGKYLQDNPSKALLLTGKYSAKETNKTEFSNLGMARAEAVKEQLVKNGAASEQITVEGVEKEKIQFIDKKAHNPVSFEFSEVTTTETTNVSPSGVEAAPQSGNLDLSNGMTLYFKGDAAKISSKDPELSKIIEYLESYIATNPGAVVTVTGYTDNQGSYKNKMKIAKQRATRVRRIIRDYGGGNIFKSKKVVRKVIGPKQPIGDNETEDGRAINNRVTITIE